MITITTVYEASPHDGVIIIIITQNNINDTPCTQAIARNKEHITSLQMTQTVDCMTKISQQGEVEGLQGLVGNM